MVNLSNSQMVMNGVNDEITISLFDQSTNRRIADFYDFYGFYDFYDFNDLNGLNDLNDSKNPQLIFKL